MNWSRVCSAILPNESSGFIFNGILCIHGFHRSHRFLINVMVRSEFYNGALKEISSWDKLLSRYWLEALFFLWKDSSNYVWICIDALLHFIRCFKDLTYWNFISFLLYSFFFLSLTFPFIRILYFFFCIFFLFDNKSKEFFMSKEISVATMIGLK